ncbi:hypothetical protein BJ322DRAFT_1068537 [Thelephora terrestris]|uniref:Uncharacterized protein n=1 Tax=Thelephora terrestris TaxID=56493 RepID=A0A9P6HCW9_9AGAM|nr:hypothetical protein BJ322DRAFT_1068537 [Thelephora terrestris]
MVTRTRRAALRDRTPVTNTPARSTSKTKRPLKGKAKNTSVKVSKKRKSTPPPDDVEAEDEPAAEDELHTREETEKSQEEFSIGGFSFEDSQQSGLGLPGIGLGESVILQSTPAQSWRRRQPTTQRVSQQSRSASIMKQPAGLKASSPLPPSSPLPTSPFPSSRPVVQALEPERELEFLEEAPSEHLSDDPFGFLSAERKLRAKKGQPKRVNKGKAVDRFTPTPEPAYDDNGIEDLYASGDEAPPPQRHQTPPPRQPSPHSQRSSSLTSIQSPHTPSTPSKRNSNKRRLSQSGDSSPELSAAPTSPSPSKPRVSSKPSAEKAETSMRGRTRKKRKSEEKIEEEEGYDEEMDPSQIVEHLEALLPKPKSKSKKRAKAQAMGTRRSSRKTTRRGKAPTPSSEEDESEPSPPRRTTSKRGKKPASRIGKAKKDEEEDIDLDELEKARRERLEYFKNLENYQLAKENVYVV